MEVVGQAIARLGGEALAVREDNNVIAPRAQVRGITESGDIEEMRFHPGFAEDRGNHLRARSRAFRREAWRVEDPNNSLRRAGERLGLAHLREKLRRVSGHQRPVIHPHCAFGLEDSATQREHPRVRVHLESVGVPGPLLIGARAPEVAVDQVLSAAIQLVERHVGVTDLPLRHDPGRLHINGDGVGPNVTSDVDILGRGGTRIHLQALPTPRRRHHARLSRGGVPTGQTLLVAAVLDVRERPIVLLPRARRRRQGEHRE